MTLNPSLLCSILLFLSKNVLNVDLSNLGTEREESKLELEPESRTQKAIKELEKIKNKDNGKRLNSSDESEDEKEGGEETKKQSDDMRNDEELSKDIQDGWLDNEEDKDDNPDSNSRLKDKTSNDSIVIEGHRKRDSEMSSVRFKSEYDDGFMNDDQFFQNVHLEDMDELERVRFHLQKYAKTFNCNLLINLYNLGEYKLACVLMQYYIVIPTEQLISHSIESKNFTFLKYIWKYGRNYVYMTDNPSIEDKFTFIELLEAMKKN